VGQWDGGRGCLLFPDVSPCVLVPLQGCELIGKNLGLEVPKPLQSHHTDESWWLGAGEGSDRAAGMLWAAGLGAQCPLPTACSQTACIAGLALGFLPVCINPAEPGGVGGWGPGAPRPWWPAMSPSPVVGLEPWVQLLPLAELTQQPCFCLSRINV